jgi:endonuclease/exonuclease/phosphatase family metal-dependent hydrolase
MRRIRMLGLLVALAIGLGSATTAAPGGNRDRDLTVMTRNLYVGADLDGVLGAQSFIEILFEVQAAWTAVEATDYDERAKKLADEIVSTKPDLVGLQEASIWRIQSPGDILMGGSAPATEVVHDFVETLLDELALRGMNYEVAVSLELLDVELPSITGDDIRLTDRDVVLARKRDNGEGPMKIVDTSAGVFTTLLQFPAGGPGGPLVTVKRGYTVVDGEFRGRSFRFVNSHLENDVFAPFQEAQTAELLAGPLNYDGRLICLGDFNSDAFGGGTASYSMLLASGLTDAWTGPGGATWGHDADLLNADSAMTQRIDLVLVDGALTVKDVMLVGVDAGEKTPSGLWPSDHAGVVARLRLDHEKSE